MGFSSLHVCMESSSDPWLQGTIHEESAGMDSSSSPSGDMIACSRPMTERKQRPPQDQALKCPRCDSTHTKFCYYNNYSLSQPRYFCKACRRYWTKGGTLRNIPVGGGCRKNKKVSSKKSNDQPPIINNNQNQAHPAGPSYLNHHPKELQLSNFPDVQYSHISNLLGTNAGALMGNPNFMESKYSMGMVENPRHMDLMESSKMDGVIRSSSRNLDFFGMNSDVVSVGVGVGDVNGYNNMLPLNYQGLCSSAFRGMSLDGNNNSGSYIMESCQRFMLPSDSGDNQYSLIDDVKPNPRLVSLEWQEMQQGRSDGKEPFGYLNGPGSWTGVMNGYGSSTTKPLV